MKAILITVALLSGITVKAQTNYSGNWKLSSKEYINGPQYGNALPEDLNVVQTKDSIKSGIASVAMNGGATTTVNKETNRKAVRTLVWSADKKTVTFTTAHYAVGSDTEVELTRIDTWTLSPDDKQLIINRKSVETKSENWEVTGIYTKQ